MKSSRRRMVKEKAENLLKQILVLVIVIVKFVFLFLFAETKNPQ